ncbi:MAG TPA: Veg protein [Firmicutes bacterium]|jgi:uncharacterized protein Veg|nr:Veg protein [Bacillota bacterium]HOQ23691.1 Veg family protein [Bacillota bacterium]HPT67107.1 Veg family protein [Bacillota bacterium]
MNNLSVLERIRESLGDFVGQEICLRANKGRKRILEAQGILEQVYPRVFVVRFNDHQVERRVSYSYADLLTETVELSVGGTRIGKLAVTTG